MAFLSVLALSYMNCSSNGFQAQQMTSTQPQGVSSDGSEAESTSPVATTPTPVSEPLPLPVVPPPVVPSGPPATAVCPTTNSNVALAGGIQLAVGASRAIGVAPLAIFFDATSTTSNVPGVRSFHDLEYRWNFGESGSGNWSNGAKAGAASRNLAMGPVAAHVFESPGIYAITVSAFNGLTTVSYSCNITVTSVETEFVGNKTVCVSGAGNFAGCPTGATQVTSNNPTTAVSNNIGAGNKRFLFARGETFNTASSITINRPGPGMIGAFGGTGAKPVFSATTSSSVFSISSNSTPTGVSDWRFQDLAIDGNLMASGFYGAGSASRVLIYKVDLSNIGYGLILSGSVLNGLNSTVPPAMPPIHAMWDEFYVVASSMYNLIPGLGPNSIFANCNRMAVMGNSINNNQGGEHGIRMQLANRAVFSDNTIQGIASDKVNLTIRGTAYLGSTSVAPGTYSEKIVISNNKLVGGSSAGIMGIGPQNGFNDERGRDMIVERNWFVGSSFTQTYLSIAQSDITVRNNLVYGTSTNGGGSFVSAKDEDPNQVNIPTRVNVYNNSMYSSSNSSSYFALFMAVPNNSNLNGSVFDVHNNLLYAPGGLMTNMIGNTSSAIITTSNNSSNVAESPLFLSSPPTEVSHFRPAVGSYANGTGVNANIFSDFHGLPTHSLMDIGAVAH